MQKHDSYGFVRVGVSVPRIKVADCVYNTQQIIEQMKVAEKSGVVVLVFPELSITGYTAADLFHQEELRQSALSGLSAIAAASKTDFSGLVFVGLPLAVDDQLFNCAAAVQDGKILGIVPKSFIPNYKEFYELRWFAPASQATAVEVELFGQKVPFGTDLLFPASDMPGLVVGAEICEDLWVPIPPSSYQALAGANLLVNLSASNELIGKAAYRRQLVANQSARLVAAYAYASCGTGESSTDVVFSGHSMIAENGSLLVENKRFERHSLLQFADIDLDRLKIDRLRANSFGAGKMAGNEFRRVSFKVGSRAAAEQLAREIEAHPFVPRGKERLAERCEEIFNIQVAGLAKRLEFVDSVVRNNRLSIGVSGGLDSTLALLVLCKTLDLLGLPRKKIQAFTMPGFGTTSRTKNNAHALMKQLGVDAREVDIRPLCFAEMKAVQHKPFGIDIQNMSLEEFCAKLSELPSGSQDLVFENTQARQRTSILMNSGFVIGTGDVSELVLGWCTYNADHMSMYNPNVSIPKTLVKFLVDWAADHQFDGETRVTLKDVVGTEISPELLPPGKDGKIAQKTESAVGPYELTDFFLYHLLRFGMSPPKIFYLACQAKFNKDYSKQELRSWLKLFFKRFFSSQFKRSALPDGPKVGSVSVSPRGDWRMPTDAQGAVWLAWLEEQEKLNPPVKRALGLVDPLNGFASATHNDGKGHSAELPVPGGEEIGAPIGILQEKGGYAYCFAGVDRHPKDMFNFASQCPDKKPYVDKVPDRDGQLAVVYPDHCQEGSWSADYLPGVRVDLINDTFPKGTSRDKDSHSACGNAELIPRLKALGITDIDLVGLVFRICVGYTALDLVKAGFRVRVITDCTRDLEIPEFAHIIDEMKKLGVEMITSEQVLATVKS
ncbi:MAG: NAD(+) synthase [Candidatus Obscuribacterales bacterium]|nr:NAD(+) synthase [Candidatus Obscuribacterales bacterium]